MSTSMQAIEWLQLTDHDAAQLPSFLVLAGDETLFKRLVIQRLRYVTCVVGELEFVVLEGDSVLWADVHDQLNTRSLFGGGGTVLLLRDADGFVTAHRAELERLAENEIRCGTLILDLQTFPATTRLAKIAAKQGLVIHCRIPERKAGNRSVPDVQRLRNWLVQHAQQRHALRLTEAQVVQIMDLVGDRLGLIDSELSKLALFADINGQVSKTTIDEVVGGWRTETTWELLNAACRGDAASALAGLERLLAAGESPQAMFGAISWSLRRFAAAVRFVQLQEGRGERPDLVAALVSAGVPKFPAERFQTTLAELRQIGRQRAEQLYGQLLAADMKLKGTHAAPERGRWVLEELVLSLASAISARPQSLKAR